MTRPSNRDTHAGFIESSGFAQIDTRAMQPAKARRKPSRPLEFVSVYLSYRKEHGRVYAARIAWGVAFNYLPF